MENKRDKLNELDKLKETWNNEIGVCREIQKETKAVLKDLKDLRQDMLEEQVKFMKSSLFKRIGMYRKTKNELKKSKTEDDEK